jgi:gliding motility-associated lipoprotein GldH
MNRIFILGTIILILGLVSCEEQPFYQKSYSFKSNTWARPFKPFFKVIVKDTSVTYDFIITLRTTTSYSFNNSWIYFISKTPDKQYVREPFEIKISDEKGRWIGNKTGSIVENKLLFKQRKLPHPGVYYFMLEQGITKKVLYDVLDIGLEIREYSSH